MSLRNEAQFVVSNDAMTQKPQQDTNPPYGGGGAVKTTCNTVATFSKGWHIFLLIVDSPGGYCPVTYIFRKLSSN